MNELFQLLVDNKINLTGGERDGEIVGVFTDNNDPEIYYSIKVRPCESAVTVASFIATFANPAVISIKHARQRVKIESIREQAQEIFAKCDSDEDLAVYAKVMGNVLDELERWCSVPEKV